MHGTLLGWWWNRKVRADTSLERTAADDVVVDSPLGFRFRCASFRSFDALPRVVLQHVGLPLQDPANSGREGLHAGGQSALCE